MSLVRAIRSTITTIRVALHNDFHCDGASVEDLREVAELLERARRQVLDTVEAWEAAVRRQPQLSRPAGPGRGAA